MRKGATGGAREEGLLWVDERRTVAKDTVSKEGVDHFSHNLRVDL